MDDALHIVTGVAIPACELRETTSRSGGPGGQHVNTTNSRVTLYWALRHSVAVTVPQRDRIMQKLGRRLNADGEVHVTVDTERSQHANRKIARSRLAALIRSALLVPERRIPTKVPQGVVRRRLRDKAQRSRTKRLRARPTSDD